ncbi:MAG: hypothetical protein E7354_00185 [Clostridiales bacterium]|nr:hypothetical protein [Clostridiales bacterium]
MDFKKLDPGIRRGIKTIVQYWEALENNTDFNEDSMEKGIWQLLTDSSGYENRDDIEIKTECLQDYIFKQYGYQEHKALILKDKLVALRWADEIDEKQAIDIIREFDSVSNCLADLTSYPSQLIQSLFALDGISHREDISPEFQLAIWYILSMYPSGYPDAYVNELFLEKAGYDYKKDNFMSPEEHEQLREKTFLSEYRKNPPHFHEEDEEIDPELEDFIDSLFEDDEDDEEDEDELEEKKEIYGTCVQVRFPNNKTYKYNCKYRIAIDIYEGCKVRVSGKMKDYIGIVTDIDDLWDTADYMEEVIEVIYEDE